MMTVDVDKVTLEVSLLVNCRNTASVAGCASWTGKDTCCPGPTVRLAGRIISELWTVTLALAAETPAGPVA